MGEEFLDVVDETTGEPTGEALPRSEIHARGLWHRVAHVWYVEKATGRLVLQKRHPEKESYPNLFDISAAGHISAGETSLFTAERESEEELGLVVPTDTLKAGFLFTVRTEAVLRADYTNREFCDVYLVELDGLEKPRRVSAEEDPRGQWEAEHFVLQETEVSGVKLMPWREVRQKYVEKDEEFVPADVVEGDYRKLFEELEVRYP